MEPIAVGSVILIGTAALIGVVVGAIGLAAPGAGVGLILLLIRGRRLVRQ